MHNERLYIFIVNIYIIVSGRNIINDFNYNIKFYNDASVGLIFWMGLE